jgi:hypothetical protein
MTRQAAQARESSGAIDFDAALEAYLGGRGQEALLRAAGKVIDCDMPFAVEHADTISKLIDDLDIDVETYGDAARFGPGSSRYGSRARQPVGAATVGTEAARLHLKPGF